MVDDGHGAIMVWAVMRIGLRVVVVMGVQGMTA